MLGGLANDGTLLIATRFIKGVSAAFTAPAALSIITTTFAEGRARNKALAVFSRTGAAGFSLGPPGCSWAQLATNAMVDRPVRCYPADRDRDDLGRRLRLV